MNLQYSIASAIKPIGKTVVLLALSSTLCIAAIEAVQFENRQLETRYQDLIAELRCLVCQNQNLADSDASLAKDLRKKTEEMLKSGKSDQEILAYMQERYGDFVLYRPPLTAGTTLLWVGPFVLLFLAAVVLIINIRRRQQKALMQVPSAEDQIQQSKVQSLLKNTTPLSAGEKTQDHLE